MRVSPTRGDLAVSAGVLGLGLAEVWVTPSAGLSVPQRAGESVAIAVIASCLTFRRSFPLAMSILALAILGGASVAFTESRAWSIAVVMLATYSAGRLAGLPSSTVVMTAAVGYAALVSVQEGYEGFWNALANVTFIIVLMILIPWGAGLALLQRERANRQDAARAVEDERVRIARELHDIVGHALGVIVVQAEGERATLPPDASDSTREALTAIARCAREALDDVRRLLVVMRSIDHDLVPQPGLADVPRLLEVMTAAGLSSDLEVIGEARALPPGVDLSAFRVVQEALTNSLRHSHGARAHVILRYDEDTIGIDIRDDGPPAPRHSTRGFGLAGMRERVALFGGDLDAGPQATGGFRVSVHLPTEGGQTDDAPRARV